MNEIATTAEVFKQFAEQQMEGCSSFVFPDELQDQPFECYIAPATSGPFQSSYSSAKTGEIVSFGKYLKFVITPKTPYAQLSKVVFVYVTVLTFCLFAFLTFCLFLLSAFLPFLHSAFLPFLRSAFSLFFIQYHFILYLDSIKALARQVQLSFLLMVQRSQMNIIYL